jgi:hypothetical protein
MDDNKHILYKLIPGFGQGITRVFISYPFDVIKIQLQKLYYKNSYDAIKNIIKTDIKKLYRGSSFMFFSVGFERSFQFYYLEKYKNNNKFYTSFQLSLISSIYNLPMQYITTHIAINNKNFNFFNFIKDLNIKKMYRGYTIETLRNSLGTTIYYGSYMTIREKIGNNLYLTPFYGGFSGILVWLITFPFDTIRTEYQTQNNIKLSTLIINCYTNNGILSFYKGLMPVLLRTLPSSSIGMFVYEFLLNKCK